MANEIELDPHALIAAHKAVEDVLVELRDRGVSVLPAPANGFVVRYADGAPSDAVRLTTREGLTIAIKAYLAAAGSVSPEGDTPQGDRDA